MIALTGFLVAVAVTVQSPTGYTPLSNLPAIGWTAPSYSPNLITVNTPVDINAAVTDQDKYQLLLPPNSIETVGNADTEIVASINSGSPRSDGTAGAFPSTSFDPPTGKKSYTWKITTHSVPTNETRTFVDTFVYKDLGSGVVLDPYESNPATSYNHKEIVTITLSGSRVGPPGGGSDSSVGFAESPRGSRRR